jgi:glycosyltransferase involved in cell wall biosynthesis
VDGENGILVDGNSTEEFAAAALRLFQKPELAERLGRQGFHRAQNMSGQMVAEKFRASCLEVIRAVKS